MLISVIIPNWNAGDLLRDAILSIIDDEAVGEIIVVDNASTDGSADRVAALGLPKLVLIRNDQNVGATKARHIAATQARHELIAFLDADDLLSPGALSSARGQLLDNDLDMCSLQMVRLFPDGHTEPFVAPLDETISGQEAFRRTLGGWTVHPMGIMRRDVYLRAISAFEFHGHSDDEVLTRHLFLAAGSVGGVHDLYLYRTSAKQITIDMVIGQARTELAVLQMAVDQRTVTTEPKLRKARNHVVRMLLSLWNRLRRERKSMAVMVPMLRQIVDHRIGWRLSDWRHFLAFTTMRASVPLLNRRKP